MRVLPCKISVFVTALLGMGSLAGGSPVVTMSTTPNIGGSGYEAIDFYYASSAGAEFTNYRLNLETTGGYIYDPLRSELQNTGGNSIDTYMNTVGSYLGISDAIHIQNTYKPTAPAANSSPISRIDWSVFDTLSGDSNAIDGYARPVSHGSSARQPRCPVERLVRGVRHARRRNGCHMAIHK